MTKLKFFLQKLVKYIYCLITFKKYELKRNKMGLAKKIKNESL